MVLFFAATLALSIAGLVVLLALKRWELATGRMFAPRLRPGLSRASVAVLLWFENILPRLFVIYGRRLVRRVRALLHHGVARGLLSAEHGMERMLRELRGVTEYPKSNKEASIFLREVAEHKRKLLHSKRRMHEPLE